MNRHIVHIQRRLERLEKKLIATKKIDDLVLASTIQGMEEEVSILKLLIKLGGNK